MQIYKLFTFVQKKSDYFTKFIIFIRHLEGSRGQTLRLSYLASRARTHAKRARTRTACRQSHPRGPLTPLQTSPITRRCASHRYLYRVFMGATVNRRLRASGLRPQPWHLIEVLNATCGACLLSLRQKKKPGRKGRDFKRENRIGHPIHCLNSAPKNIIRRKTKM